jgi:hypothetical protein
MRVSTVFSMSMMCFALGACGVPEDNELNDDGTDQTSDPDDGTAVAALSAPVTAPMIDEDAAAAAISHPIHMYYQRNGHSDFGDGCKPNTPYYIYNSNHGPTASGWPIGVYNTCWRRVWLFQHMSSRTGQHWGARKCVSPLNGRYKIPAGQHWEGLVIGTLNQSC